MIPTLDIRRVTGKPGSASGAFTVRTGFTSKGEIHRAVYLGAERSTCQVCGRGVSDCGHISAARRLIESEARALVAGR